MKTVKIVIVEDDTFYNISLTRYISNICNQQVFPGVKFEILSFLNAHECIEQLSDDMDILLLDFYLVNEAEDETLDGFDVINEVKKSSPNCLIVVLSNLNEAQKITELLKSGIYDYVDKNAGGNGRVGALVQKAVIELTGPRAN